MSRFAALDLTTLPDPTAIGVLDFDAILEARLAELEAQLSEVFDAPKVAEVMALARNIAASPIRYLNEAGAARELYMENRINEAVRSVFLSTARGNDLDQIGANRGVLRKVLDDSDPDNPVMETDEALRARIQLVIEAWSPTALKALTFIGRWMPMTAWSMLPSTGQTMAWSHPFRPPSQRWSSCPAKVMVQQMRRFWRQCFCTAQQISAVQ